MKAYSAVIIVLLINYTISSECNLKTIKMLFEKAQQEKNMDLIGANPLISSGTNINDLGRYDACLRDSVNNTYILAQFPFGIQKKVNPKAGFIGLCLPKKCNTQAFKDEIKEKIFSFFQDKTVLSKKNIFVVETELENNKNKQFDAGQIIVLILFIIYLVFGLGIASCCLKRFIPQDEHKVVVNEENNAKIMNSSIHSDGGGSFNGSIISLLEEMKNNENQEKEGFIQKLVYIFDFKKNFSITFEVKENEDNEFKIFDGIKVISMIFIIISSLITRFKDIPVRNRETIQKHYFQSFWLQWIFNSSFTTDIFFAISGFILAYFTLQNQPIIQNSLKKIFSGIFLKFLSLWPLFFIIFLFYWKFYVFFMNGPFAGYVFNKELESCSRQFPFVFFLLTNFSLGALQKYSPLCYSWTWYVSDEFQLTVLGIILITIFLKHRRLFMPVFGVIWLAFFIVEIVLFSINNLGPNVYNQLLEDKKGSYVYYSIFVKSSPYFIGLLLGIYYAEFKLNQARENNSFISNLLHMIKARNIYYIGSFILGLFIMFWTVFIVGWMEGSSSHAGNVFYNILSKKFFIVAFFMMIFPIMLGKFENIAGFLKIKLFIVLSKLTLTVYIIHPMVINFVNYNSRTAYFFNLVHLILYSTGYIVVSYILAIFVSVVFERPFLNLKKLIENNQIRRVDKIQQGNNSLIENSIY